MAAKALVRPIASEEEIELVAWRMRLTLKEVVGPEGEGMYSLDWLRGRVREHLRPGAAVFVAEVEGEVVGHTIVRVEGEGSGLFSTTWVHPDHRRMGLARALLDRGEHWMRKEGLGHAETCTASHNAGLIALYEGRGYRVVEQAEGMVRLRGGLR